MKKQLLEQFNTIISALFDSHVATYQVCDKDETDEYFKHYLILIFKDRRPHTIYNIKNKDIVGLLDEIRFLYEIVNAQGEETK